MAFVKEEIPKEMIEKYDIKKAREWCIDRERDAMFYHIGGNPRGPETNFLFIWKDHKIEIGSIFYETIIEKNESSIKTEIDWRDTYVSIPKHLEVQKQEILTSITEAFSCNNYLGKKVIFDPKMNYSADKGTGRWQ